MLVSSLFLGARGIRRGYVKKLCLSLLVAGVGMAGFGLRENICLICLFGFIFFAALPFANNCLDYLVRGAAWIVTAAGVLLGLTAAALYMPSSVRRLEKM